jgi:hypothetical protein
VRALDRRVASIVFRLTPMSSLLWERALLALEQGPFAPEQFLEKTCLLSRTKTAGYL